MKKYEFTGETKKYRGPTLHRIRAVRSFGNVKKGDLGGFIESEDNLAHDGNAWVYDNAKIYGEAWVGDNARVYGNAVVCDNAKVFRNAQVFGSARINGNSWVYGSAWVGGNTETQGTWILGDARIYCAEDLKKEERKDATRIERKINRRGGVCGAPIRR